MKKGIMVIVLLVLCSLTVLGDTSKIDLRIVNQDPDPAIAGDIVEVRIGVENKGEDSVDDLMLAIVPEYPYEAITGEDLEKKVPTLGSFQVDDDVQIVKFKVRINRDATAGEYDLKVDYWSESESQTKKQATLSVDVDSKSNAESIYIDKYELLPGEITPMTFTINNVGSAPLRELTFHWENEDGVILPVGSDNTRYVKYIDGESKAELVYNVIASGNAEPDLYELALKLTYDDPLSDEEQVIETSAGVYVGGTTDFDVAYSGVSQGETAFSVSNIGSVPARSVTVSVPRQQGWRVSGTNAVIIGNLDKGDYTVASFQLSQTGSGEGLSEEQREQFRQAREEGSPQRSSTNAVEVAISYTDTRGERHTISKEVFVDPSASRTQEGAQAGQFQRSGRQQQSSSNMRWIVLGAAIVIVLFFVRRTYRKRRLANPDYTYGMLVGDTINKFRRRKI